MDSNLPTDASSCAERYSFGALHQGDHLGLLVSALPLRLGSLLGPPGLLYRLGRLGGFSFAFGPSASGAGAPALSDSIVSLLISSLLDRVAVVTFITRLRRTASRIFSD